MRSMARRSRKSLSGAVKRKPSTSPFVPRLDLIFQAVKKSVSLRAGVLRGGPSAPEKIDRKSTRLNSSHGYISHAVFCLKKKKPPEQLAHPRSAKLLRHQDALCT